MRVVANDESIGWPEEASVSYSTFLAGTKLSENPSEARDFLTNPRCQKVSSKRTRNYFESYIDGVSTIFSILSERADALVDGGDYSSKDELLEKIFDWEAIELRLGTIPGPYLIDGIQRGKEEIEDVETSDISRILAHIASVLRRYRRKLNSELTVQISWRSFSIDETVVEIIEEEGDSGSDDQSINPVLEHTLLAVFDWSGDTGTWQVAIGQKSGIKDLSGTTLERIGRERGEATDIVFREVSSFPT